MRRLQFALFLCGGVNANPERFGQYQQIVSASGIILFEMRSLHSAGDGEAKNGFGASMLCPPASGNPAARRRLDRLVLPDCDLGCQLVDWPSQNGDSQLRGAPHRVDVRYGIGGGDATKVIGVVDDRHEKIRRGEHRSILIEDDCRRIVSRLMAYQ